MDWNALDISEIMKTVFSSDCPTREENTVLHHWNNDWIDVMVISRDIYMNDVFSMEVGGAEVLIISFHLLRFFGDKIGPSQLQNVF